MICVRRDDICVGVILRVYECVCDEVESHTDAYEERRETKGMWKARHYPVNVKIIVD